MSKLKEFGVYLLTQENIRKNSNTGVEALTIEEVAELHANAFEVPDIKPVTKIVTEPEVI